VFPVVETNRDIKGSYPAESIAIKNTSDAIGIIVAAKKQVINNPKYPNSNVPITHSIKQKRPE
jgi:hypothetical protein